MNVTKAFQVSYSLLQGVLTRISSVIAIMLILWTLLMVLGAPLSTDADQLQKLLNFVNGGGSGVAVTGGRGVAVAPPIPFAEVADPRRGVVPLDVPQPKGAQVEMFLFLKLLIELNSYSYK